MAEFYAILHSVEEKNISARKSLSESFFDNVLLAEKNEKGKSTKEEICFSMRPRLLEKITNLVPDGIFENGSVLDIGSGYGAVVGYFSLINLKPKEVIGVELFPSRVDISSQLLQEVEEQFIKRDYSVIPWSFYSGDVRKELEKNTWIDIFSGVTVLIINNFVFDSESNQAIISRLLQEMNEAEDVRTMYVFTTFPLANVRRFEKNSWQRFQSPERFHFIDPEREATFEDFVKEIYVLPIVEAGMVSWSNQPKDLTLYGIRLTNEDVVTDGAFFESFLSCDALLHQEDLPLKKRLGLKEKCMNAWNHGISVIGGEKIINQLIALFGDFFIIGEGKSVTARLIVDIFEENLLAFDGEQFFEDWKNYLERKTSDIRIAGLLGERLDILVSASYRLATTYVDEDIIIPNEEEKTLTPEIRNAISLFFDPKSPFPPGLEVRKTPGMGKGIYAKEPLNEDWISRVGGDVIFLTSEKVQMVEQDDGAEYLAEFRGRFVLGDMERTVWVDTRKHWSGLFNHSWDSPIPFDDHPCPRAFANMEVDEEGTIHILRKIEIGEQILWDYGIDYWMNSEAVPVWDVSSIEKDCLKIPALRKEIAAFMEISIISPKKDFLIKLKAKVAELSETEEDVKEDETFDLKMIDVTRILTKRLVAKSGGTLNLSERGWDILKILDKVLKKTNSKLLNLKDSDFERVMKELLIAQDSLRKQGIRITGKKLRKILDDLISKERTMKRKKREIFPYNVVKEVENYERVVGDAVGVTTETNIADVVISGKEEEIVVLPPAPLVEAEVDAINELEKITRRLGILWSWFERFAGSVSSLPGFEEEKQEKWFEEKLPKESIANRNDNFVLLAMGDSFLKLLQKIKEESRTYETEDERIVLRILKETKDETTKYLWSAFDTTGTDVSGHAYWKPSSDAAVIRGSGKLQFFLQELSKALIEAIKNTTGKDFSNPPIVSSKDSAWVIGGTKEADLSPKRPGTSPPSRKFLVSAQTRAKRSLAKRNEEMFDLVRTELFCPEPQEGEKKLKELSSKFVITLADVLAEKEIEILYDFNAQCGLLSYALASKHGISCRIGCSDSRIFKYHDQVSDFLVEHELLEVWPELEITGGLYNPNFDGVSHLFIRKVPKEQNERMRQNVVNASKLLRSEMIVVSVDDRKKIEEMGFDLGDRITKRERPPGLNVYFHIPLKKGKEKKKKKKKKIQKASFIDQTKESSHFVIDLTKANSKLTTKSITIFSESKTKEENNNPKKKMSQTISFGSNKKVEEEEKEEAPKASGAVTYAKNFNYDKEEKEQDKDKYDSEEEEEENIRAKAKAEEKEEEEEEEEYDQSEEVIKKTIEAVRLPFGKGKTEEKETTGSVKIPGFSRFGGSNPDKYLRDAQKKVGNVKAGSGSAKIQDVINDVKKLKGRAEKNAKKMKWEQSEIVDLSNKFDKEIEFLKAMKSQATKASGALPLGASKKIKDTNDMHVHHMEVQPGATTAFAEDIPHDVIMQVAQGKAKVNLKYTDSKGEDVERTKDQEVGKNLIIPKGASYSITAPKDEKTVVNFITPVKF